MAKLDENSRIQNMKDSVIEVKEELGTLKISERLTVDLIETKGRDTTDKSCQKNFYLNEIGSVSQDSVPQLVSEECDACPYCADICLDPSCGACIEKDQRQCILRKNKSQQPEVMSFPFFGNCDDDRIYSSCEVRRHCTESSAWLVAGDVVYDATKFIPDHPGGRDSILRRAGGCMDCSEDIMFHSKKGQKLWKICRIGKVRPCPGANGKNIHGQYQEDQCIIS